MISTPKQFFHGSLNQDFPSSANFINANEQPRWNDADRFASGYQENYSYLQAALQLLMDNLESATYVFEQDAIKYQQYEKSASQKLYNEEKHRNAETPYVVKFQSVEELAPPAAVWTFHHRHQ
ncbi:hypothetical protein BJ742DRAFT_769056 [Cladochytrium replicatum]|nr:hypothetical protein BJ742DRAFT_769056 [Cladochytrium replicatum]